MTCYVYTTAAVTSNFIGPQQARLYILRTNVDFTCLLSRLAVIRWKSSWSDSLYIFAVFRFAES